MREQVGVGGLAAPHDDSSKSELRSSSARPDSWSATRGEALVQSCPWILALRKSARIPIPRSTTISHAEGHKNVNTSNRQGCVGWRHRSLAAIVTVFLALGLIGGPMPASDASSPGSLTSVIVREAPQAGDQPELLVAQYGGAVTAQLPLIGGFTAVVPADVLGILELSPHIEAVTLNAELQLSAAGWEDSSTITGNVVDHPGSLHEVTRNVNARELWRLGTTGAGVDIALIDSGVAPVDGLTAPGKVVNGPDLSFESQYDNLRHLDTFGHGTHMAGIMAGRDDAATGEYDSLGHEYFVGVAPDARVVSIKVADAHGVTDVSQVIAAITWVIEHKNDNGMNIRVLNLSFGTDSTQSYVLDPLAYAVEQAWHNGIVVVVAAGNDGNGMPLRNPASDPYVIAVGAVDENATKGGSDDFVPSFSNCGTAERHVDVVASGRSILSLRAPGSYADAENPGAVVEDRLFVGSGTSQAAAVISGVAALVLEENPDWTPDQVKAAITNEARALSSGQSELCQGAGTVDAAWSAWTNVPKAKTAQKHELATGLGTLEGARGTDHLSADGVVLEGETDIMGNPWLGFNEIVTKCWKDGKGKNATTICEDVLTPSDSMWDGGDWNGGTWSGSSWSGSSWSGSSWSGVTWTGSSWSGSSWSGSSWSGSSWSDATWSGSSWSGGTWSGSSWSGGTWSGSSWSGSFWSASGGS